MLDILEKRRERIAAGEANLEEVQKQIAEKLGYRELWIGEMATYDAFALATAVGLQTGHIGLNIGPRAVSVRTPAMSHGLSETANLSPVARAFSIIESGADGA